MDDTLNKVNEVVLSSMRKTDKSGGYQQRLELPNGDIIYPTSFENPTTYEDQLWLNRLATNSARTDPGTRADQGTGTDQVC